MAESPLANVELHLVRTLDDAFACKRWAAERRETPLGVDTESAGLQPLTDRLRLIQLGDMRHGWAFPAEWAGAAIEIMDGYEGDFVAHNSSFDHRVIHHSLGYQIPWHKLHDTMTIAALADPTRPKGLKPLSARLIDRNATAGEKLLHDGMKANGWTWATVPADYPPYWAYAALDPVLTAIIWETMAPDVLETAPEAYDLERAVTPILASMMDHGLLLDKEYVVEKLAGLRKFIASTREWLSQYHGVNSLMSARQLHAALSRAGVEITATTKTGLPSIDKETLEAASVSQEAPQAARDLASAVLKARHGEKLAGTYLESFLEIVAPDGAIHPSLQQLMARTGRMCLAKGTMVDGPRDLLQRPFGTPIENVKPGDDVYSFNGAGNVIVQPVKAVHDNGVLPVMRLVYRRSGSHGGELLEIKATPDHRFALRTGEYRELRDLKPGDKLGFMVRTVRSDGNGSFRSELEWNGGRRFQEPRVIENSVLPHHVVHHVNGETLDQQPGNLASLTRAEHMREHALGTLYALTKDELQQVVDNGTNYHQLARELGVMIRKNDIINRCRELGIPVRSHQESIRKHWDEPCPLSPEDFWVRLKELGGTATNSGGGAALAAELGVKYNVIRKWKKEFASSRPSEIEMNCPFTAEELSSFVDRANTSEELEELAGYSKHRIRQWCRIAAVSWPDPAEWARRRKLCDCSLTATEFFRQLDEAGNLANLARQLGVPYQKCRSWKLAFSAENHEVLAVIDDGECLPVYDLEIHGHPNFVAAELWSHNSCTDPNLQNLPRNDKMIRGAFIPHPGYAFISCDASQIELRVIASLSGDENLIRAIREADENGTDVYASMASAIHGEVISKKDDRRQHLKSAVYCRVYGGGVNKIARTIGLPYAQAKRLDDMISSQFSGLTSYSGRLIATARRQQNAGEVPHVRTDTGRYLPLDIERAYAATNYVVQATAAEELKRAITRLASAGLGDALRLPVHDEVILEVPADQAESILELVKNTVREDERFAVSIPWDGVIMRERWSKG